MVVCIIVFVVALFARRWQHAAMIAGIATGIGAALKLVVLLVLVSASPGNLAQALGYMFAETLVDAIAFMIAAFLGFGLHRTVSGPRSVLPSKVSEPVAKPPHEGSHGPAELPASTWRESGSV